jgi:hypothetical protein
MRTASADEAQLPGAAALIVMSGTLTHGCSPPVCAR